MVFQAKAAMLFLLLLSTPLLFTEGKVLKSDKAEDDDGHKVEI